MMIRLKRRRMQGLAVAVVSASVIAGWGCGGGAPPVSSSTAEAPVHGTVKIGDQPATGGKISFDPANVQRKSATLRTAEIGKDGTYTITTLVGENRINVDSPETKKNPKLQYFSEMLDVKSGDNLHDVNVPNMP